jgi:2-oxoglutarate/2-oxoacid ferredoxin oxidoreductase subunit beta
MGQAIGKRGFAVVEVISHCHTQFGLKNKLGGPVEMMRAQKELAVKVEKAKTMTPEELAGKITIGVLTDRDLPIYTQEYQKIREAAKAAMGGEQ